MEWNYVVAPVFIMRYNQTSLQVKHLISDEWEDASTDIDMWRLLEQDSFPVSESKALEMHEKFKQRNV